MEFLNYEFFGNSTTDYLYFLASFLIGVIIIIPIRILITKLLFRIFGKQNDQNDHDKFNSLLKKPLRYILILVVLYSSAQFINLPDL